MKYKGIKKRQSSTVMTCEKQSGQFQKSELSVAGENQFSFELLVQDKDILPYGKKLRLDYFLREAQVCVSRTLLKTGIKQGKVYVNGKPQTKGAHAVKLGDIVQGDFPSPAPIRAIPQNIALDIVYEDENLIVINKGKGMVVHPSPGHMEGTLVNALLYHCGLPEVTLANTSLSLNTKQDLDNDQQEEEDEQDVSLKSENDEEEDNDEDENSPVLQYGNDQTIRPGIVHRLDKGTTGLIVVAKDDLTHIHLSQQFKDKQTQRLYVSLTIGIPQPPVGTVQTNIWRDVIDRKKNAAFPFEGSIGKPAISGYKQVGQIANGRLGIVEWQLQTGRTHQIRVHAKHIGNSLFGDDTYGGGRGIALSYVGRGFKEREEKVLLALEKLARPALHAKKLGFIHPQTGKQMLFDSQLPEDFMDTIKLLDKLPEKWD